MKKEKRLSHKPIRKFSVVAPFFYLTTCPYTASYAWKLILTILKDFFLLQMGQKLHITKRPVINVETAIDEKIPFLPAQVKPYLEYVPFFVKPMDMLKTRLGLKQAAPYLCLYIKYLTMIYKNAATIYRFCMTTTSRPKYYKSHNFRTIHFFDPHLLCVPSIHVAVSAGTYAWFSQCFKTGILEKEDAEEYLSEIKKHATQIVESVLFIKQHSVNCIPAAIYMMTVMLKDRFSIQDAVDFMDCLFVESTDIPEETKKEINTYIHTMFERFLLEGSSEEDWTAPIKNWLTTYKAS